MPDIEKATNDVDKAWERLRSEPSPENEAAYDVAYENWKGVSGTRGVGRPASSDGNALNSSQRAQAARVRQQRSAEKWEKVAPIIQSMREALLAGKYDLVIDKTKEITKATEMVLSEFNVIHAQRDGDFVVLHAFHGKDMVLIFIPKIHLEDHLKKERLSGKQANAIVARNIDTFARIISGKYERGEYRYYSREGLTLPRIDIILEDIEKSGELITDTILETDVIWQSLGAR